MLKWDVSGWSFSFDTDEAESLAKLIAKWAGKLDETKFELIRQSNSKQFLSPIRQKQILELYGAMLKNPDIADHVDNMNTVDDIEYFLGTFDGSVDSDDDENWLVLAEYKDRVVSFLYGELNKATGIFGLWYLVGPKNVRYMDNLDTIPAPDAVNRAEFCQVLVLKLFEEIRRTNCAMCIIFEVDATNLKETRGVERKRMVLYSQMETLLTGELRSMWTRPLDWSKVQFDRTYVLQFIYYMPQNSGEKLTKVPGVLSCIPLTASLCNEFRTGKLSAATVHKLLDGIYRMYYDIYPECDPVGQRVKAMAEEIIADFDATYQNREVSCMTLEDYRKTLAYSLTGQINVIQTTKLPEVV